MTTEEMFALQPGDIVSCNKRRHYVVTDYGVPCEFLKISYSGLIKVKVISGRYTGSTFDVNYEWFDKIPQFKEVAESELTALFY